MTLYNNVNPINVFFLKKLIRKYLFSARAADSIYPAEIGRCLIQSADIFAIKRRNESELLVCDTLHYISCMFSYQSVNNFEEAQLLLCLRIPL